MYLISSLMSSVNTLKSRKKKKGSTLPVKSPQSTVKVVAKTCLWYQVVGKMNRRKKLSEGIKDGQLYM